MREDEQEGEKFSDLYAVLEKVHNKSKSAAFKKDTALFLILFRINV
jgi:hypothetical protein